MPYILTGRGLQRKVFNLFDPGFLGSAVIVLTLYLLLSMDSARIDRRIFLTTQFSDALVSLERMDDLLILNTLSPSGAAPFAWILYRAGLLVQGKTDLSVMKANKSFLGEKGQRLLTRTDSLFGQLQKGLLSGSPIPLLAETDRRLLLLSTELSNQASSSRRTFLLQGRMLNIAREFVVLTGLLGGGIFLLRKARHLLKTSRQNSFYRALSWVDRLILPLPEMETLLSETCRIIVEEGGLLLVRFVQYDTVTEKGRPLATFGKAKEEFSRFVPSTDPSVPEGQSLWGETIRAGIAVVWNRIRGHPGAGFLRERYLENGILSGAGFPVFRGGTLFGALLVYSDEEDFFDTALVELIEILSQNISFAIDNRDREEERKNREEEVTHLSLFDPLTNLPNRRLFHDRIHQAIERHFRTGERFGVGILDLDGFKQVNDRLGHPAGDRLLVEAAGRLQGVLRGMDTLARLGGDEFGFLFAELEGEKVSTLFKRVIDSLALPFVLGEESVSVGGSLGITIIPPDEGDDESLLKHADIAMYRVKEHGKNGWELFSPAMADALEKSHQLREDLVNALQENRFVLHYQPQVEMSTGTLAGVEALLRWNHPDQGWLDAEQFISVLEGSELIIDTGRWILEQVLSWISDWSGKGITPKVSMNIGIRHLLSGTFVDDLRQAFLRHPGVFPQSLELKIPDIGSFRDLQKVKEAFDACRHFGVSISTGNIGVGHGSLSLIQTLGVDRVTIDRRFVRRLPDSPKDMAIVASLVTSAQLMLVNVIGEGIETEEEGSILLQWGCRIGQGFAISPPMLPEKLPEWTGQYRPFDSWTRWKELPWEPREYPLLMAREAARVFYKNFLEGIDRPGETRLEWTDSHRCLQGRWIDGNGGMRYGSTAVFREYREAHEHLHSLVREALLARDAGDAHKLGSLKQAIRETNGELIRMIARFET